MEELQTLERSWGDDQLETPFGMAESYAETDTSTFALSSHLAPWSDGPNALADEDAVQSETERDIADLFETLRDEAFDNAVTSLAEETELTVADHFTNETSANAGERERFAERHLDGVRYEAEGYLTSLQEGLAGVDVASYSDEQLNQFLDSFDRQPADLSPASENFFGKLVKKAKKAVKWVAKKAKKVAGSALLGPILKKLKGLVNPLLKRVLAHAIGRLPAPLQPIAKKLASRIKLEDEGYSGYATQHSNGSDIASFAEQFDSVVAESLYGSGDPEGFGESDFEDESIYGSDSRQLEVLSDARGQLLDRIANADNQQDLTPEIEQFLPVLLGALRIGIKLIGRPKVVGFLAKYLAKLIQRWVGPQLAGQLSNAIVDTGLKLVSLEAEDESESDFDPRMLSSEAVASVIEDTVRRFAENEDFVFGDDTLAELAAYEAFSAAAATHFPAQLIKKRLQQAPKLAGTFVRRKSRSLRPFARYTRVPEVSVTSQMADAIPAFGGTTIGGVMRSAGLTFPVRAKLHIFQALVGTSVAKILHRKKSKMGALGKAALQPLTSAAAATLLSEPKLGSNFPAEVLRDRSRVKPGQRLYLIEVLDQPSAPAPSPSEENEQAQSRGASRFRQRIDRPGRAVVLSWYISERRAQQIAAELRKGAGAAALLRPMLDQMGGVVVRHEASFGENEADPVFEGLEGEEFSFKKLGNLLGGIKKQLAKKVRKWTAPAIAKWAKANIAAFLRATEHPAQGVTIVARLTGVPGLSLVTSPKSAVKNAGRLLNNPFAGSPEVSIRVVPGTGS